MTREEFLTEYNRDNPSVHWLALMILEHMPEDKELVEKANVLIEADDCLQKSLEQLGFCFFA